MRGTKRLLGAGRGIWQWHYWEHQIRDECDLALEDFTCGER